MITILPWMTWLAGLGMVESMVFSTDLAACGVVVVVLPFSRVL